MHSDEPFCPAVSAGGGGADGLNRSSRPAAPDPALREGCRRICSDCRVPASASSPPEAQPEAELPTEMDKIAAGRAARRARTRPKLIYLVTEDWYFWSHRLPIARAARDAGFDIVVAA